MATVIVKQRHALGLPAGSVRATHVLGVVALTCAILLIPSRTGAMLPLPPYLIYLMFLMLGHYFGSHGNTIATRDDPAPSPLYLPGGMVRVLIVVAIVGTVGWRLYDNPQSLMDQFEQSFKELQEQPYLPLIILGGFLVGVMVRAVVGHANPPLAWQDFEAWLSVIALVGLGLAAVNHLFIQTSMEVPFGMPSWEAGLGAVLAFYFGARS